MTNTSSELATTTVLVVDDNPVNIKLLQKILEQSNYLVRAAVNGELALKSAKLSPPDLILMDIHMPVMDGFDACKQLKRDIDLKEIPVIFVSASSNKINKIKAFKLGCVDYIVKPFEIAEVRARVNTHIKIRKKMNEICSFNRLMMVRENRVIELKQEVNRLMLELDQPIRYTAVEEKP